MILEGLGNLPLPNHPPIHVCLMCLGTTKWIFVAALPAGAIVDSLRNSRSEEDFGRKVLDSGDTPFPPCLFILLLSLPAGFLFSFFLT